MQDIHSANRESIFFFVYFSEYTMIISSANLAAVIYPVFRISHQTAKTSNNNRARETVGERARENKNKTSLKAEIHTEIA